ncbi:TPA: hypothetical protein I7673_21730 [Vibrio vulnificus]|nr:hypothetical protein [Vibrio vulnificus]
MSKHDEKFLSNKSGVEVIQDENENPITNLLEFWRWSYSNIMYNTIRGDLAEFIVFKALENELDTKFYSTRRDGDVCDFQFGKGIFVEVKSAAYIQAWEQKEFSPIEFDIRERGDYDFETGKPNNSVKKRWANVYVFALLKEQNREHVDPTQLSQWEFWVANTADITQIRGSKQKLSYSMLADVKAKKSTFETLASDVKACFARSK